MQKTAFCFDYGAHLLWNCFDNLMQCHNIYSMSSIHFWPRFCIDDRGVEPFRRSLPLTPNTFNGVKVRTLEAKSCVKITPQAPMILGIVVLEYARATRDEKTH